MNKERARANNQAHPLRPVNNWENDSVKGHALCAESVFCEHVEHAQALRKRQTAYLDSLPINPIEANRAALDLLRPGEGLYPEGFEEALHLSYALSAMVEAGDKYDQGRPRDAAIYTADRMAFALHQAARQLDRISDILRNPERIEREKTSFDPS